MSILFLGGFRPVVVADVSDVSEAHATSIFRVEEYRLESFCENKCGKVK
jgi:hypothetical protein